MRLAWLGAGATFFISVLAGSGCSTGSSATEPGAQSTAQAIQNGSIDSGHKFAVGICIGGSGALGSGICQGVCSGALILPNVIATARHCVSESPELIDCSIDPSFGPKIPGSFRVTTNTTMEAAASGWYGVKQVYVPDDDHICGNDIALLELNSAISGDVATPITPGVQYVMWDPDHYTSAFVGIGYGKTSPGKNDSGTRRISKPISVLCADGSNSSCPKGFSPKEFVGSDGPCQGDSGSSAYEYSTFDDGAPVSFGVLSRGGENSAKTQCENSVYTRFDAHRDFVLDVAKIASNDWTAYPEPSWTAYAPPPTPKGKDAGTSSKDAGTKDPAPLGLGESCETADECESGNCADQGDGELACTQACDASDETSCPEGLECREDLCLPPLPEPDAPAATTTTTTGCSAAPGSSGATAAFPVLGAALALGALRRRRGSAA